MKKNRILIVDDTPSNLTFLTQLVGKLGGNPILASSGEEALQKFDSQKIDLIIMDFQMPGLNGIETSIKIKEIKFDIPILLFTMSPLESVKAFDEKNACDYYISKEDIPTLKTLLQTLLDLSEQ